MKTIFFQGDDSSKCLTRKNHEIKGKVCEVRKAVSKEKPPQPPQPPPQPPQQPQPPTLDGQGAAEGIFPMAAVSSLIRQAYALGRGLGPQAPITPSAVAALLLGTPTPQQQQAQQQQQHTLHTLPPQQPPQQQQQQMDPAVMEIAQVLTDSGISAQTVASLLRGRNTTNGISDTKNEKGNRYKPY